MLLRRKADAWVGENRITPKWLANWKHGPTSVVQLLVVTHFDPYLFKVCVMSFVQRRPNLKNLKLASGRTQSETVP